MMSGVVCDRIRLAILAPVIDTCGCGCETDMSGLPKGLRGVVAPLGVLCPVPLALVRPDAVADPTSSDDPK